MLYNIMLQFEYYYKKPYFYKKAKRAKRQKLLFRVCLFIPYRISGSCCLTRATSRKINKVYW